MPSPPIRPGHRRWLRAYAVVDCRREYGDNLLPRGAMWPAREEPVDAQRGPRAPEEEHRIDEHVRARALAAQVAERQELPARQLELQPHHHGQTRRDPLQE